MNEQRKFDGIPLLKLSQQLPLVAGFDQDELMSGPLNLKDAFILRRVIESEFVVIADGEFFTVLGLTATSFRRHLMKMVFLGFLEDQSPEEKEAMIRARKDFYGLGFGHLTCAWCAISTLVLHSHHHPVPKFDGGTETVSICPNCHHEFHSILAFKPTE